MCGRLTLLSIPALAFCLAAFSLTGTIGRAAPRPHAAFQFDQPLSVGSILVANEKLGDPNFAESVILLLQYDEEKGAVGLILNRRTRIPLSRVFPKTKQASADLVYMGGPVEITAGQALLRMPEKSDQATHIMADVYVTGTKDLIEKSVAARVDPSKFRLYLGYAGWAPDQLEAEIRLGAWSILHRGPQVVFDDDPDSLWSRLIRQTHMQVARAWVRSQAY